MTIDKHVTNQIEQALHSVRLATEFSRHKGQKFVQYTQTELELGRVLADVSVQLRKAEELSKQITEEK